MKTNFPDMTAITVCFWSKVKQHASHLDSIFAYTSPFNLTSRCDDISMAPRGTEKYHVQLKDQAKEYNLGQKLDQWTYTCITWKNSNGELALHVNGSKIETKTGIKTNKIIYGKGEILLGLERDPRYPIGSHDEKCDRYAPKQMFKGEITYLYMWNKILTQDEIGNAMMFKQICDNVILDWKCFIEKSKVMGNVRLERLDTNEFMTLT